ncbi:MAG: hypothetical protein IKG85_01875 [Clostridia bacterium]|nr:hypothetical protein [Clostridia bacterium]
MKRVFTVLLCALFIMGAVPVSFARTERETRFDTPAGYNANDYQRCAAFLEQEDESGVKNGEKLSDTYDPNDPDSWGVYVDSNGNSTVCFRFEEFGGEKRLVEIKANGSDLVGTMDMSGCTRLQTLNCVVNRLSGMVVDGCSALRILNFLENEVASVDVSDCPELTDLGAAANFVDELDLSNNPQLHNLFAGSGKMRELDLSNNPLLPMQYVSAEGNGGFSYMYIDMGITDILALYPAPYEGATFVGWFTEDGVLVNSDPQYFEVPDPWSYNELTAVYSGGSLAGDVNGDGSVSAQDALLVLRFAMSLVSLTPEQQAAGDVNGDGAANASDALLILRTAMSLG